MEIFDMGIEDRLGISTHFIPSTHGETLIDAIREVSRAGFAGFEVVPTDAQAQIGYPYNYQNVGLWYRDMTDDDKSELKKELSRFRFVTIHGPHLDLNIASANRGIREESIRQYEECLQLALELGVKTVTFHAGGATWGYIRDPKVVLKYNIDFAERALDFANKYDLYLGYEVGNFNILKTVVDELDSPRFGINLDLGHAIMGGVKPERYIEEFSSKIAEIHMNGVCHYWGGYMEHVPVHRNNSIDYQSVFTMLRDIDYRGPIICELQGNDIQQVIEVCNEAKDMITGIWNGSVVLEEKWNRPSGAK